VEPLGIMMLTTVCMSCGCVALCYKNLQQTVKYSDF